MGAFLQNPFWPVAPDSRYRTEAYGISQNWSGNRHIRACGCGSAAALMVLGYLHRHHPDGRSSLMETFFADPDPLTREHCAALLDTAGRRYFPVIPRYGMNGLALAMFMNRYFRRHRMDWRASWCSFRKTAERRMEEMLREDIPVIFSVGPDFPLFWQKHPLDLYAAMGETKPAGKVRAHYMVATGMDKGWIRLSSWGREYWLPLASWEEHHRYHSGGIVDGIVWIRQKG